MEFFDEKAMRGLRNLFILIFLIIAAKIFSPYFVIIFMLWWLFIVKN